MKKYVLFPVILFLCFSVSAENVKFSFSGKEFDPQTGIPEGWVLKGRTAYPKPVYSIVRDGDREILRIDCRKGSGMLIREVTPFISKFPVMRWKWRVRQFPQDADGRNVYRDDQPIAIYLVTNRTAPVSVCRRWDTLTPKGEKGSVMYALGLSTVHWKTQRNASDGTGKWHVEEVNLYQELLNVLKGAPVDGIGVVIGANSQCTKSDTSAEIEYIEFLPAEK